MPKGKKKIEGTVGNMVGLTIDEDTAGTITPEAASTTSAIDIYDEAGNIVRTYSLEEHGPDFMQLADSLLAGHPKFHK